MGMFDKMRKKFEDNKLDDQAMKKLQEMRKNRNSDEQLDKD